MADELISILSNTGLPTGEIRLKSEAHQLGLYHASVHIWLYTAEGNVLIQKRAANKDTYPNLWDISVAGHIGVNETPIDAALREIKEEIGITMRADELQFITRYLAEKRPTTTIYDNEFHHIYVSELTTTIASLNLQEEEVADIQLVSLDRFMNDIHDQTTAKQYVPHSIEYYERIHQEIMHRLY